MITTWIVLCAAVAVAGFYFAAICSRQSGPGTAGPLPVWLGAGTGRLAAALAVVAALLALGRPADGLGPTTALAFVLGAGIALAAGWFAAGRATAAAGPAIGDARHPRLAAGTSAGMFAAGLALAALAAMLFAIGEGPALPGVANRFAGFLGLPLGAATVALFVRLPGLAAGSAGRLRGLGNDLVGSQLGAIAATVALAAGLVPPQVTGDAAVRHYASLVLFPVALAATGLVASLLGGLRAAADGERTGTASLSRALLTAAALFVLGSLVVARILLPEPLRAPGTAETAGPWQVWLAALAGLAAGLAVGKIAEFHAAPAAAPAQNLAERSRDGAAAHLRAALAAAAGSPWLSAVVLAVAVHVGNELAGRYGVGVVAIGALSTLGSSLAREVFVATGAAGRLVAARAKGQALGGAALTTIALLLVLGTLGDRAIVPSLGDPSTLLGLGLGALVPFAFVATIAAASPEARHPATTPALGAAALLVALGMVAGRSAAGGFVAGATAAGALLAFALLHGGGLWMAARDYLATGPFGGKDGDAHRTTAPTAAAGQLAHEVLAPAIADLWKLLALTALLAAPLFKNA